MARRTNALHMLHINVEILEFPSASSRNFRSSHWTWICDCEHFVMFIHQPGSKSYFIVLLCFALLCWRPTERVSIHEHEHEHVLVISHVIVQRTKHYQHHQVELCKCCTKHKHFLLLYQLCHEISISNINSFRKVTYFIWKLSIGTRKWWIVQQCFTILLEDNRLCNVHQAIYKSGVVNFGNCCKMVNWFE